MTSNTRVGETMMVRTFIVAAIALTTWATIAVCPAAQNVEHRAFRTPEEAVQALIDVVKAGNVPALVGLFGADGQDLVASSDAATARQNRETFTVAIGEGWHLVDTADGHKELVVGNEEWPFPVPLVKSADGWRFDTAAGKEEVLARRIGRNELAVIQICRAYVAAQHRYAAQGHDGKPARLFARTFDSDPGKQNGLYWPTTRGQQPSPLGDLVAQAAEEGRPVTGRERQPAPFHGYYFKILTAQGPSAAGGAKSYVVNDEMSGGFALIAWPSQYDATGVMTFIVGPDGVVYQKDLGPETEPGAKGITKFDPDKSWTAVQRGK